MLCERELHRHQVPSAIDIHEVAQMPGDIVTFSVLQEALRERLGISDVI